MALSFTKLSERLLANPSEAVQYIEHTIWQVAFQNVEEPERKQWTESVDNNAKGIFYLAKGNKLPQPQLASEASVAKEKSLFDSILKQQYDSKIECFLKATEKGLKSALQQNEIVEQERFTYLEIPFKSFPKYTPVFHRRTNMAEYCLIVTGCLVRVSQDRAQDHSQEESKLFCQQAPKPPATQIPDVSTLASGLASALLKGIGSKVGALIFDEIFPPGTPSYFDEVYKEIEKIVQQEITENTIAEVNGKINGMKDWVAITYSNAKESGESKQELTALIQPKESQITIDLIGVLMDERFAKPALRVFMIAAGMHFAILQELAFEDPKVNSPSESPYAKSVQDYAEKYANHANTTFNSVMSSRLDMIKPGVSYHTALSSPPNVIRMYDFYFEDKLTGYESKAYVMTIDSFHCYNKDAEKERDAAMETYCEEKRKDLVTQLEDPVATADEWLKLKTQPLPSQE